MHPPAKHVKPLGHMVQASPFEPQGSVGAMGTTHLLPRQQPEQLAKLQDPEPPELLEPPEPPELREPPEPPELLDPELPELLERPCEPATGRRSQRSKPMGRRGLLGGAINSRIASNTTLNCASYFRSSAASLRARSS